jgi:uncharacterized membrane protein
MKNFSRFVIGALATGALILAPIYLAALLLLKAMNSLTRLVKPLVHLLPAWLPAERVLALLLVVSVCLLVGLLVRTPWGASAWERIQGSLDRSIPGYGVIRSLTQQLAGQTQDAWQPALVELEEALVPAFIIEVLADGSCTVFVPSAPTPMAGAIYILKPERVHPLKVPFAHAVRVVSRWGSGSTELVAAMEKKKSM